MNIALSPQWKIRLAAFVAVLVSVSMPLRASGVATQQGALGLALIAALILFFQNAEVRAEVKGALVSLVGQMAAAVFFIWGVTALFSPDLVGSYKIIGRSGFFLLSSVVIWAVLLCHQDQQRLLWKTLIISTLLFVGLALVALNGVSEVSSFLKGNGFVPGSPEGVLKAFSASVLCLVPVVAWAGRRLDGTWRWAGYSVSPLALVVIVQTSNRAALAGFIAMAFSGVVLTLIAKRKHVKIILSATIAGIAGAFSWLYFHEVDRPPIAGMYLPEWLIDPHRQYIWKFAFDRFLTKPWFGSGIDQINKVPGAHISVPGLDHSAAFVPSHPHNWVIEILSEAGIIGLLPLLIVLGYIIWRLIKRYLHEDDESALTLLMLMAGFWTSALFNFSIWAVWWELTFFILFAVISSARARY